MTLKKTLECLDRYQSTSVRGPNTPSSPSLPSIAPDITSSSNDDELEYSSISASHPPPMLLACSNNCSSQTWKGGSTDPIMATLSQGADCIADVEVDDTLSRQNGLVGSRQSGVAEKLDACHSTDQQIADSVDTSGFEAESMIKLNSEDCRPHTFIPSFPLSSPLNGDSFLSSSSSRHSISSNLLATRTELEEGQSLDQHRTSPPNSRPNSPVCPFLFSLNFSFLTCLISRALEQRSWVC